MLNLAWVFLSANMKDCMRWKQYLPAAAILITGLALTLFFAQHFWKMDDREWGARAFSETRFLSRTLHEWIESSFHPLSALGVLLENSKEVTIAEFHNTIENMEIRSNNSFMQELGVLEHKDGQWQVFLSSTNADSARIRQTQDSATRNSLLAAIKRARAKPNEWQMSHPVPSNNGSTAVYICLAFPDLIGAKKSELVLVGLLDIEQTVSNLLAIRATKGIYLKLVMEQDQKTYPLYSSFHNNNIAIKNISNASAAGINLSMEWGVSDEFEGGRTRTSVWVVLVAGTALSFLAAWMFLRQAY